MTFIAASVAVFVSLSMNRVHCSRENQSQKNMLQTVLAPKPHTTSVGGTARRNINKYGRDVCPLKKCFGNVVCLFMKMKSKVTSVKVYQAALKGLLPTLE